ncbi:MAG: PEP-CTERM system histidine kinase PrsK [Candidatus Obscuribacterales bacterium]|nr:PEP-CTERM system histidine kinase PrsK [Steroidobacteraceae bacterium]
MKTFGIISYAIAAIAFWGLLGLMLASWRGRAQGARLIVAIMVSAIWASTNLRYAWNDGVSLLLIYVVEMSMLAAWIVVVCGLLGSTLSRTQVTIIHGTWIASLVAPALVAATSLAGFDLNLGVSLFAISGILLAVIGLIVLEQVYRNSSKQSRGALRYFAIGVGAIFTYDLFLYSQIELLRGVVVGVWNARGLLALVSVPLIALGVSRNPDWSLDLFVSRQVVFYTSTFIAVGAYFLAIAVGGYYVRVYGGKWGIAAQVTFFFGAGVVLFAMLTAGLWQRRLKVFISKHFYRNKYDYRVEWLRFIDTLSAAPDIGTKTTAIRAVANIFNSPGGILFWQAHNGQPFAPLSSWPEPLESSHDLAPISADTEMLKFMAKHQWIIDTQEYRRSPDLYQGIAIPAWVKGKLDIRIVAPLLELDRLVGFIALREPPPPFELTYEDRDLLKTVGRHVATHIAQFEASQKLIEGRQLEAYGRLTAFVMHDLKNAVAQLQLLIENAARHRGNPAFFDDAISTISNTTERMTRLIEQLRVGGSQDEPAPLQLADLLREACSRCADRNPKPQLPSDMPLLIGMAHRDRLVNVLEHLLRNAQDASSADGCVAIELEQQGGYAVISVADDGSGMSPEFVRDRLFRPFDTTKGSRGMGVGAYQAKEYVQSLGGIVNVQSIPGRGTRFSLSMPLRKAT